MQVDDALQFPQIDSLTNTLIFHLAEYLEKKFSQYPYVKNITVDNIVNIIQQLSEEKETENFLNPTLGLFAKAKSIAYNYTAGFVISETPYHRLEHLRYFANKATSFRDLTKKLMSFAQLATLSCTSEKRTDFSANCVLLCTEMREFFLTAQQLITLDRTQTHSITSTVFSGSVQGMIGKKKRSDLADMINQKILLPYKDDLEKMIGHIRICEAMTLKKKEGESQVAVKMLSRNRLPQNAATTTEETAKNFTNQHNTKGFNLLHEACRDNDEDKTARCLSAGADPNLKTLETPPFPENSSRKFYRSPLCLAILDDSLGLRDRINLNVINLLLTSGANVDELSPKDDRSFIHLCVFRKNKNTSFSVRPSPNLDLIKLLLSHHCDLKASDWEDFATLLADSKNTSALATLLRAHVDSEQTATKSAVF